MSLSGRARYKSKPSPRGLGFAMWLKHCYEAYGRHGWHLVEDQSAVAREKGYATFPADADDALLRAEALGWIIRGRFEPTPSQGAFLGLTYTRGKVPEMHASCWFWSPAPFASAGREIATWWLKRKAYL